MNQHTLPTKISQVTSGPLRSLTTPAQLPNRLHVPLVNYLQMLEQELESTRKKMEEYETTIAHQANLLCQASLIRNHSQTVPHAFPPDTYSSNSSSTFHFQDRSLSILLGAQGENPGIFPYRSTGFDRFQLPRATSFPGTVSLPSPSWLGTHPYLASRPNPAIHHPSSLNTDFPKRQRDWTDGESELASKKVRHSTSQCNTIPPPPRPDSFVSSYSTPADFCDAAISSQSDKPDWSVENNPELDKTLEVNLIRTISDERGAFRIKFSPDGQLLAIVARWSQVVTIYNVSTGARICLLEDHYLREAPPCTYDLIFSSNGKYLATCTLSPENIIRIWEVGKKHVRNVLKGHLNGGIFCLDISPDGRLLISGSDDQTVRIWNMRDGSSRIFNNSSSFIRSIRFSPDGRHIAAGSWHGEVLIWERRSGHLVASWKRHTAVVTGILFMPSGEGLISGSWDGTLNYWDTSSGATIAGILSDDAERKGNLTFVGHTNQIRSTSISPDGRWLASNSDDHTVCLWNTHTGSQQCILRAHEDEVFSVHFSPAGGHFASAGEDGQVQIWSYKQL